MMPVERCSTATADINADGIDDVGGRCAHAILALVTDASADRVPELRLARRVALPANLSWATKGFHVES